MTYVSDTQVFGPVTSRVHVIFRLRMLQFYSIKLAAIRMAPKIKIQRRHNWNSRSGETCSRASGILDPGLRNIHSREKSTGEG